MMVEVVPVDMSAAMPSVTKSKVLMTLQISTGAGERSCWLQSRISTRPGRPRTRLPDIPFLPQPVTLIIYTDETVSERERERGSAIYVCQSEGDKRQNMKWCSVKYALFWLVTSQIKRGKACSDRARATQDNLRLLECH